MGAGASAKPSDVAAASPEELKELWDTLEEPEREKLKAFFGSVCFGAELSAELTSTEIRNLEDADLESCLEEAKQKLVPLQEKLEKHNELVQKQHWFVVTFQNEKARRRKQIAEAKKAEELAAKQARKASALAESLGPYASPRYHVKLSERPKITPPHNPEDWTFERVATEGFLLTGRSPTILSLTASETGEIAANSASGETLFSLAALESLTSCQGLKEKIADSLETPIRQLRLFQGGEEMDADDPITDIQTVTISVDPREASYPFHCKRLFTFELPLALSEDGKAGGCFMALYKGEPFVLLKKLTWYFKEDKTSRGYGGFHNVRDAVNLKTKVVEDRVIATGSAVERTYKEESGPSSISGPWDCVPRGPSSTVLTTNAGHPEEAIAIFNLD